MELALLQVDGNDLVDVVVGLDDQEVLVVLRVVLSHAVNGAVGDIGILVDDEHGAVAGNNVSAGGDLQNTVAVLDLGAIGQSAGANEGIVSHGSSVVRISGLDVAAVIGLDNEEGLRRQRRSIQILGSDRGDLTVDDGVIGVDTSSPDLV